MKIDPSLKTIALAAVAEERTRGQKSAEQPKSQSGASVKLSPLSSSLREIEAKMDKNQAVDHKRVAEIKKAIDEGTFKVDSGKVADRLLENTRDFLRTHKQ